MGESTTGAEADGPTVVYLGNRKAIELVDDPDDQTAAAAEDRPANKARSRLPGNLCTTVVLPAGLSLLEAAYDLTHATRGVWVSHSDAGSPAWVASTDPALAKLLADHWGCDLRDPEPGAAEAGEG